VCVCVCAGRVRPKYRPQFTFVDLHRERQPVDCPSTSVNVNWVRTFHCQYALVKSCQSDISHHHAPVTSRQYYSAALLWDSARSYCSNSAASRMGKDVVIVIMADRKLEIRFRTVTSEEVSQNVSRGRQTRLCFIVHVSRHHHHPH